MFCTSDGAPLPNVHVAVQERREPFGAVPGDCEHPRWDIEIVVTVDADANLDFCGPAVHGKRGERFLYLTWGNVTETGTFEMFRRAKLMLADIEPTLFRNREASRVLVARVRLTDDRGAPRCGRVAPPAIEWSVSA